MTQFDADFHQSTVVGAVPAEPTRPASLPEPTAVESLLLDLATQEATGSLMMVDPTDDRATVWLRDGRLYSLSVPGRLALLGVRLVSCGALTPEQLGEALEAQRHDMRGWRLGELLVHLGYVQAPVIDSFVREQMHDMLASIIDWQVVTSQFRNGDRTRHDFIPQDIAALLKEIHDRRTRWTQVLSRIGEETVVPRIGPHAAQRTQYLEPRQWAVLGKVDGHRTLLDLADECGFTPLEAGELLVQLIDGGVTILPTTPQGEPAIVSADVIPVIDLQEAAYSPAVAVEPVAVQPVAVEPVSVEPAAVEPIAVEPAATVTPRPELAALLTAFNREADDAAAPTPPEGAPVAADTADTESATNPAENSSVVDQSPVASSPSQPEFFTRAADSSLLMRELTSLSRAEDEARRGGAPAQSTSDGVQESEETSSSSSVDDDTKKRGIFRR